MIKFIISPKNTKKLTTIIFLMLVSFFYAQSEAPVVSASGNQVFCLGSAINIVTDFSITHSSDTGISSFFIQISSGYKVGDDKLELPASSNIKSNWVSSEGKLTLTSSISGTEMLFTDLENAVKNVVFSTTSSKSTIERTFSLTLDNANYLPLTGHFYEFISNLGITWNAAKIAAENRTYYGRTGYLATLTSQDEADFAGKQASGAGWIGGNDVETDDVWKWVTGPEAGTVFWNGDENGSTPNYANWNTGEPNNYENKGEDYAHITASGVGITGSWNDITNTGDPTGPYQPKGYIVEYGAPGDSDISIVATTSIFTPEITNTTSATICVGETAVLTATASDGDVLWFDALTGGKLLQTGNTFMISSLTTNKTYYATVSVDGCTSLERTAVTVHVNEKPVITSTTDDLICSGTASLSATSSSGSIKWYASETSVTPIFTGSNFETPTLNSTTIYYVEAENSNCTSSTRTEVIAEVNSTIPDFDLVKDTYFLCDSKDSVTLETENSLDDYEYVWTKENNILTGDEAVLTVTETGIYTVKAVSLFGCESIEKQITVSSSSIETINDDAIVLSNNNSLEIVAGNLGVGTYEFSLDDEFGLYNDVGFFDNLSVGTHVLYIKDKNGCGTIQYEFSMLAFPKFFTPNNDGKNDVWKLYGMSSDSSTVVDISIYNRFGVLLYHSKFLNEGWDGRYSGKLLPSNTYWYKVILKDNRGKITEEKGAIDLIRK